MDDPAAVGVGVGVGAEPEPEQREGNPDADAEFDVDGELAATRLTEKASLDPNDTAAAGRGDEGGGAGGDAEVDARQTCRHDECLRTTLNRFNLCAAHSCKVPRCSESKAASATLCPMHDSEL